MKTKKIPFLLFALLFLVFKLAAQSNIIELKGSVYSSEQKTPLDFAHISIPVKGIGTLTNSEGQFSLKVPASAKEDTLMISYLGYETRYQPLSDFENGQVALYLKKNTVDLQEIVVTPMEGLDLIQEAIEKIPENYDPQPHLKRGYYRVVSKTDSTYIHLNEAVFDVYLPGYGAKKGKDQLKLHKMRKIKDEAAAHGINLGLKPYLVFEYDIISDVKHSDILSKSSLRLYDFEWKGITEVQGRSAHEIWFDQKDRIKKGLYTGKIYLDMESLALIHMNFSLSPKGLNYVKYGDAATRTLLSVTGLRIDKEKEDVQIYYQQYGDKWYFSHCTNDTRLSFSNQREGYSFAPDIRVDYIVTQLDTTNVQAFANYEALNNTRFIENEESSYADDFWQDYNIILSDYSFEEIARLIEKRNRAYQAERGY